MSGATINNLPLEQWETVVNDNKRMHGIISEQGNTIKIIESLLTIAVHEWLENHPDLESSARYSSIYAKDIAEALGVDIDKIVEQFKELKTINSIDEGYQE